MAPDSPSWHRWLLAVCLSLHVVVASVGISAPLLEHHAFRQTQTALTAYWTVRDGLRLASLTPVLGPPWSIPFELPVYQWAVAGAHALTGVPLDVTGRFASLAAFYLSLVPGYSLLRRLLGGGRQAAIVLCFVLASPTYLFWSRAFLIESTALLLGLVHVLSIVRAVERPTVRRTLVGASVGALSGMVKVTTFAVLLVPTALVVAARVLALVRARQRRLAVITSATALGCTVPGVVAVQLWTAWADSVKASGPYTAAMTSEKLQGWTFGTLEQRADPRLWWSWVVDNSGPAMILDVLPETTAALLGAVLLLGLLLSVRRRWRAVALAGSLVLAGPLLFFNLYRHDYYQYATGFGVSVLLSLPFIEALERSRGRYAAWARVVVSSAVLLCFAAYLSTPYFGMQRRLQDVETLRLAHFVAANTERDDVVVYLGFDWSSKYAYYSERRSLMLRTSKVETLEDPRFGLFLREVEREGRRVAAVVFTSRPHPELIRAVIARTAPTSSALSVRPPVLLLRYGDPVVDG